MEDSKILSSPKNTARGNSQPTFRLTVTTTVYALPTSHRHGLMASSEAGSAILVDYAELNGIIPVSMWTATRRPVHGSIRITTTMTQSRASKCICQTSIKTTQRTTRKIRLITAPGPRCGLVPRPTIKACPTIKSGAARPTKVPSHSQHLSGRETLELALKG